MLKCCFEPGLGSCRQREGLSSSSTGKIRMDAGKKWINTDRNSNRSNRNLELGKLPPEFSISFRIGCSGMGSGL